jgi:hypothetical protein
LRAGAQAAFYLRLRCIHRASSIMRRPGTPTSTRSERSRKR